MGDATAPQGLDTVPMTAGLQRQSLLLCPRGQQSGQVPSMRRPRCRERGVRGEEEGMFLWTFMFDEVGGNQWLICR